jgi:DNA-binding LytR/AlgR family response regulator
VPVAFCTGYEKIAGLPEALKSAPTLCKPISDDALEKVLRAIL